MKSNTHSVARCFCISFLLLTGACVSHDLAEVDPPFEVVCTLEDADLSYSTDIVPLIEANCIFEGCHGNREDIPDWTQHDDLASHIEEIQRRITLPLSHPDKMPRGRTISTQDREDLYCWLENGAPNN